MGALVGAAVRVTEFGDESVLRVEAGRAVPEPGAGEVLLRVRSIGINPVETYVRSGKYARLPPLPYTPGHDCAGEVVAVGERVTSFRVGDTVFTDRTMSGAYAEYAIAPAGHAHKFNSSSLSFDEAAALPTPYFTAYRALFQRARARPGDWVLVHGATGGVGVAAVQLAKRAGCHVIGSSGSGSGREQVLSAGADRAVAHGDTAAVMTMTGGRGVDIIVEMLSNENLGTDLRMLAPGGTVIIVGARGESTINPRDLMARESTVTGVALNLATERDIQECAAHVAAAVAGGLRPRVGLVLEGLAAAPEAHREVISHSRGTSGKIVIRVP